MAVSWMAYSGAYQPPMPPGVPEGSLKPSPRPLFSTAARKPSPLAALMQKMKAIDLESDDLLMLLILYLMYRESGDRELLILMGAMLLG